MYVCTYVCMFVSVCLYACVAPRACICRLSPDYLCSRTPNICLLSLANCTCSPTLIIYLLTTYRTLSQSMPWDFCGAGICFSSRRRHNWGNLVLSLGA